VKSQTITQLDSNSASLPKIELKEIILIFQGFKGQSKLIENLKEELKQINEIIVAKNNIIIKNREIIDIQKKQLEDIQPDFWDSVLNWLKLAGAFALGALLAK